MVRDFLDPENKYRSRFMCHRSVEDKLGRLIALSGRLVTHMASGVCDDEAVLIAKDLAEIGIRVAETIEHCHRQYIE